MRKAKGNIVLKTSLFNYSNSLSHEGVTVLHEKKTEIGKAVTFERQIFVISRCLLEEHGMKFSILTNARAQRVQRVESACRVRTCNIIFLVHVTTN